MTLRTPDGRHQLVLALGVWTVLARTGRGWVVDSRHEDVRGAVRRPLELTGNDGAERSALDLQEVLE